MRLSMGGWVAKRLRRLPKGLAIIMEETGSRRGSCPMGTREMPSSSLLSAAPMLGLVGADELDGERPSAQV